MSGSGQSAGAACAIRLVAIVGSAGSLPALLEVVAGVSADFPAGLVVLQHRQAASELLLPDVLGSRLHVPVRMVQTGQRPRPGTSHVAPASAQVTLRGDGSFALAPGEPCRADPFLVSAARCHRGALLAVVLSGRLRDGAAGIREVKRLGGWVLAQHPASAHTPSMPEAALATGCVDHALAPASLGAALVALVGVPGAADLFRVRPNVGAVASG